MAGLSRLATAAVTGGVSRHLPASALLLPRLSTICSYRAVAAQPQLDYDRYLCNYMELDNLEDERGGGSIPAVADPLGSRFLRGVQWVFIGNPSAKKHVYAEMLSKLLEVPHISIGSLVRQELSPRSILYKQIASAVNQGKLVPESIIFGLLSNRLEDGYGRGETGFILDGIPRTRLQAEILDQLADIDLVVNFKCLEGCIQGDRTFSDALTSGGTTNFSTLDFNLSPEGCEPKFSAFYSEQTKLLEDYYRSQKKLIDFQVGSAPGDTWKGLLAVLHLQHFDAYQCQPSHTPSTKA
ncbi:hypothetical protein Dimus_004626 [Dionaea muscipula]